MLLISLARTSGENTGIFLAKWKNKAANIWQQIYRMEKPPSHTTPRPKPTLDPLFQHPGPLPCHPLPTQHPFTPYHNQPPTQHPFTPTTPWQRFVFSYVFTIPWAGPHGLIEFHLIDKNGIYTQTEIEGPSLLGVLCVGVQYSTRNVKVTWRSPLINVNVDFLS